MGGCDCKYRVMVCGFHFPSRAPSILSPALPLLRLIRALSGVSFASLEIRAAEGQAEGEDAAGALVRT